MNKIEVEDKYESKDTKLLMTKKKSDDIIICEKLKDAY